MTIHTSPTPTEIEASVKETIHSLLSRYPEHNRGSVLNEVLRHSFQTITIEYGKTLPKELRWCEKLPTIVLLEESIPAENQLMAETITQNDTITTQDKPITERCSTPNDTTHGASATQDTPNPESLPEPDNTAQDDASATQDASSPERSSTSANASTPKPSSTADAMIQELMAQAENFAAWTKDPSLFWNYSTQSSEDSGSTVHEREVSLCEDSSDEFMNAMAQSASRGYRAILVYLLFKRSVDSAKKYYIRESTVCKFLTYLGLPIDDKNKEKYLKTLYHGRRRLEFCHHLSRMNKKFQDFSHNSVNFGDIKYGFLYLSLDERMWNKATAFRDIYHKTVHDLDIQKVLDAVETSGAHLAAKTVLQYRQALVQGQPALSIGKIINCTLTLNRSEAENTFQEPRAPADESNGTVASKRSSTEAGLDDPTALKRSRQNMDILVEAVMCQSATASETVIANDSNLHIVQLNNAPSLNNTSSPNSEINQNLVDTQASSPGDENATGDEPPLEAVANPDPVDWITYLDTVESNLNVFELFGDGEPDFDYSFGESSLDTTGPSDLIKTTETLQVGS